MKKSFMVDTGHGRSLERQEGQIGGHSSVVKPHE